MYIRKYVWDEATIANQLKAWAKRFADRVDPKRNYKLASSKFAAALENASKTTTSITDAQEHNHELRPKPGSTHSLRSWRSSRGAKIEVFHDPSKHFGNVGMEMKLFQAVQMEGTTRFNARRIEEAKQQVGPDGDNSARKATRVFHFSPWLRRECNRLARTAGQHIPYEEDGFERREDNGERFYMEYAIEQARRRAEWGGRHLHCQRNH